MAYEGPIPLTDDFMEELFGGAELIRRVYHRSMSEEHKPKAEETKKETINRPIIPNGPMRRPPEASPLWICNAKSEHKKDLHYDLRGKIVEADQCHCVKCMLAHYPLLSVGEPVAVHPQYTLEVLKESGVVGLYKPHIPVRCPCAVCGKEVESCLEDVYETSEIVHLSCMSFDDREALRNVGYTLDYLIRKRREDESQRVHEEDGPRNQGGEPGAETVGELLQGDGGEEHQGVQEAPESAGERPKGEGVHHDPEPPQDAEERDSASLHSSGRDDASDG